MLSMPSIERIRKLDSEGKSVSEIARQTGHDRKTITKYLDERDFSPQCPTKTRRPSKLDPYKPFIDNILIQDQKVWRKQRHSAARIFERLKEETDYSGGITIVQSYVSARKKELGQTKAVFLDLEWEPGTAQIDFCDVDVRYCGRMQRMYLFSLSFPYSNTGFCQLFSGLSAECICQGLLNIFLFLGLVPHLVVLDNATGAVRRIDKMVKESALYEAMRLHFNFTSRPCNPASGHEKGNIERKGAYFRSHLFVPCPAIGNLKQFNEDLLKRCVELNRGIHYRKNKSVEELFEDDMAAMHHIPKSRFSCRRWESYKTDKYGEVTLDKTHTYDIDPTYPLTDVWVGFGAYDIVFAHGKTAEVLAVHPRQFGSSKTHTSDPLKQLLVLQKKPGGFSQSVVRAQMDDPLREYLDGLKRTDLKGELTALAKSSSTEGYKATMEAREKFLEKGIVPSATDLCILARRIREQQPIEMSPIDLSIYDCVLIGKEA